MLQDAGETPLLVSHLRELDLELEELQLLLDSSSKKLHQALLHLWEDHDDLEHLGSMAAARRSEIDIFDVLRLDGSELFHSNFLAWLLDPQGSHGLGENFLRRFLRGSGAKTSLRAGRHANSTVHREREITLDGGTGRLDVFIVNQSAKFLCAIENKVWSSEGLDQLAFYRKALEYHYPYYKCHLVFLTPGGDEPESAEEQDHWDRMSYKDVLRMVERTTKEQSKSADADVAAVLRQYAVTLRRNIVPEVSNDAHSLARKIYRKHKQAIDLIIEHRERYEPNYPNERFWMVREAVRGHPELVEASCNHPIARFVPADWRTYEGLLKSKGVLGGVLVFQVFAGERKAGLNLCLNWSDSLKSPGLRTEIYDLLAANSNLFQGEVPPLEDEWITLRMGELLEESDYETWWDEERTKETISRRLDEFVQGDFQEINGIIVGCLKTHAV